MLLQPSRDGADRFRSGEVADDWEQHVARLELLHEGVVLFARQIAAQRTRLIRVHHQVRVGWRVAGPAAPTAEAARHPVRQVGAVLLEELVDVEDSVDVLLAEREVMLRLQPVDHRVELLLAVFLVGRDLRVRLKQIAHVRRGRETVGPLAGEQLRQELGPVGGRLEERLVHQVQIEIAAADVDDHRHLRLERGDVGEVLLRADAHVNAALLGDV